MPLHGQHTLGFSLRATIGADYAVAARDGEWWLMAARRAPDARVGMKIKGLHNAANALASLALGEAFEFADGSHACRARHLFRLRTGRNGLRTVNGVTYINDSKGPMSARRIAAVSGMMGPLIIIAGGDGKNQDFSALADAFRGKVRHTVLTGAMQTLSACSARSEAQRKPARPWKML